MEPAKKKDREEYQLQQMMLQLQQKEADRLKRRAADRQGPFTDPAPSDPTTQRPQCPQLTISDDRTRDSSFERTGQRWIALSTAPNTPPPIRSPHEKPPEPFHIDTRSLRPLQARDVEAINTHQENWSSKGLLSREQLTRTSSLSNPQYAKTLQQDAPGGTEQLLYEIADDHQDGHDSYRHSSQVHQSSPALESYQAEQLVDQKLVETLAKLLGIPNQSAATVDSMRAYISSLQRKERLSPTSPKPCYLVTYYVFDDGEKSKEVAGPSRLYLDRPRWKAGARRKHEILAGDLPVDSLEKYLSKHPEVSFIVSKKYDISTREDQKEEDCDIASSVHHDAETLIPAAQPLRTAFSSFKSFVKDEYSRNSTKELEESGAGWENDFESSSDLDYATLDDDIHYDRGLAAPYLSVYHSRGANLDRFTATLQEQESIHFRLVLDYIMSSYGPQYADVDAMTAKGKICHAYIPYLFRPGMLVVSGKGEGIRGHRCRSSLIARSAPAKKSTWNVQNPFGMPNRNDTLHIKDAKCIRTWSWDYDNGFKQEREEILFTDSFLGDNAEAEQNIDDLSIRPLLFTSEQTRQQLENRGRWFWKCRVKQMVSYVENASEKSHYANEKRYMIDMQVYQELHGQEKWKARSNPTPWVDQEEPPGEDFIYLAPLTIKGYNLKTKKWQDLKLDGLSEVTWNTAAFDSLVLNWKTKKLIQALISNQIEAEMSTDIIEGKGNGLIMLLHGGPGTGKTLTAESVAEIARRPLFPVTCGDIGTEPASVERYLESVLHLGKTWGCVVLLDEADVFLEQRSLEDLHRNALVSVFLRVLEYYDGILVLTSNRVGTFDEAFRSRIQLAIHYTSLSTHQRMKIWENFFNRLEKLNEEGIDFLDLKDNVEKLAKHKMNGREIRNVVTIARQFARWERKQPGGEKYRLDYEVMEEVIETSVKFDKYIAKLNGGFTPEQLAEDDGLRLAKDVE